MTDHLDRLRLARTDGVGPILYRRLLRRYHTPAAALAALPELARAGGRKTAPLPPDTAQAEREVAALARIGAHLLFLDTPEYPPLLALLDDAPPVIAVQGDAGLLVGARTVALVGGRNASVNGLRIAEELAAGLARAGIVVVSGLARGIDAAGHVGALRAGRTIAAIAGGLDVPYPPENAALQARIAAEGVIVAEATLGTTPQARHFPRRNRIIAGLSLGVVVIEAAPRSGSLITARLAEEAGRELFAVPGSPLDPRCRGSNDLLRHSAHMTETAEDVLRNLPDSPLRQGIARSPLFARGTAPRRPPGFEEAAEELHMEIDPGFTGPESARNEVIALLGPSPVTVDDLVRRCQLSAAVVTGVLLELELGGRIQTLPGNRVARLAE
jgi:DNA processing protein